MHHEYEYSEGTYFHCAAGPGTQTGSSALKFPWPIFKMMFKKKYQKSKKWKYWKWLELITVHFKWGLRRGTVVRQAQQH